MNALTKLANQFQEKLAQSTSGIWYGKLEPNDPRRFDPMYGGETPPEGADKKPVLPKPPAPAQKPGQPKVAPKP